MTQAGGIDLVVDLREHARRIEEPAAFMALWQQLSPTFAGRVMEPGRSYALKHGAGAVTLTVIRNTEPGGVVSPGTAFAVRSILQPPETLYTCYRCREQERVVYGPFTCHTCRSEDRDRRICDEHVVIVDGLLRSFCADHAPHCSCGRPATFWCPGPGCRRRNAWCDVHRRQRKNDADNSYCETCYGNLFPACEHRGCENVGSFTCEFVDERTAASCGKRMCPHHAMRWQIYGPERDGLALCAQHRGIRSLSDTDIVYEMVAATAMRRSRSRRTIFLPTLQSVRHILRKARNSNYDLRTIAAMFENFSARLGSPADGHVKALLEAHRQRREADLSRESDDRNLGVAAFARVQQALIAKGQAELASVIRFSDFRPRKKLLFVEVPQEWKARFIGKGGSEIRDTGARAGVELSIERDGEQRSR